MKVKKRLSSGKAWKIMICLIGLVTSSPFYCLAATGTQSDNPIQWIDSLARAVLEKNTAQIESFIDQHYLQAMELADQYPLAAWIDTIYPIARELWIQNDVQNCLGLLQPLRDRTWETTTDESSNQLGRCLNLYGVYLKRSTALTEAITTFIKAIAAYQSSQETPPRPLPAIRGNIGNAYRVLGDYGRAIDNLSESYRLAKMALNMPNLSRKERDDILSDHLLHLSNLGLALNQAGQLEESLEYYFEAIELAKEIGSYRLPGIHNNTGICLMEMNRFSEAEEQYMQAISLTASETLSWARYMNNYLSNLLHQGKNEEFLLKLKVFRQKLGSLDDSYDKDRLSSVSFVQEGLYYEDAGDLPNAQSLYIQAFRVLSPNAAQFFENDLIYSGTLDRNPYRQLEIIAHLSRIQQALFAQEGQVEYLFKGLSFLDQAEHWIDSLRSKLENRQSRIILNNIQSGIYQQKADVCFLLYQQTNRLDFISEAFDTFEHGKAAGMWSEIQQTALKTNLIPQELLDHEVQLKNRINEISALITEELERSDPRKAILTALEHQKFEFTTSLDSLIRVYNQDYPDYYALKFDNQTKTLTEVQEALQDDQVMIQLFATEKYLHQIVIDHEQVSYRQLSDLVSLLKYRTTLSGFYSNRVFNYSSNEVLAYQSAGWEIYKKLFEPIETLIKDKKIIILPDIQFIGIPFDALVTEIANVEKPDFRDLSYFIHSNQISYSYTASLWLMENNQHMKPNLKGRILAFAPDYNADLMKSDSYWKSQIDLLPNLIGTQEELKYLARHYKGHTFQSSKAREITFKRWAQDADIIHLAMHSLSNESDPLQSALIFCPLADDSEDGRLTAAEILNLKLNNRLTVLSACNTGTGKLEMGEGVISLARSFITSGCPSVVITLWALDDIAGAQIIKRFYHNLAQKMSMAEALREAKLHQIAEANTLKAHPYFWAGMVPIGSDLSLELREKELLNQFVFYSLLSLILWSLAFLIYKKKNRHKSGG